MRTSSKCDLRQLAPSTALRTPTHEGQRAGQVKLFTEPDRKTRDPTLLRIPRPTTENPQRWELVCRVCSARPITYCTELATDEKTLLAFEPTNRMVPRTITRLTVNITAYSALSCAYSLPLVFQKTLIIFHLPWG